MPRETSSLGRAGWRSGPRKSGIFRRGKTPGMAFPWPLVGGLVSAVVADPGGAFAGTKRRGLAMPGFRQSGGPVAHENQLLMKTLAPPPRPVFGGQVTTLLRGYHFTSHLARVSCRASSRFAVIAFSDLVTARSEPTCIARKVHEHGKTSN